MTQDKKQSFTNANDWTLEGVPCSVAGWRNDYATVAPSCGGYWRASWDAVERAYNADRSLTANDVHFSSWAWLGIDTPMPDALRTIVPGGKTEASE
jgi:hypothetical protein